jgi:hypothetical protein
MLLFPAIWKVKVRVLLLNASHTVSAKPYQKKKKELGV